MTLSICVFGKLGHMFPSACVLIHHTFHFPALDGTVHTPVKGLLNTVARSKHANIQYDHLLTQCFVFRLHPIRQSLLLSEQVENGLHKSTQSNLLPIQHLSASQCNTYRSSVESAKVTEDDTTLWEWISQASLPEPGAEPSLAYSQVIKSSLGNQFPVKAKSNLNTVLAS